MEEEIVSAMDSAARGGEDRFANEFQNRGQLCGIRLRGDGGRG